ncbi:unnamed protein product [Porites evermanni]|uniref:Uncharacterized protein n=1 Tax=Porites evermanni TaxID=104178 RepID=A0ABN8LEW9_9CNID|nr:unnamed protein product [Porites evermanni]
MSCCAAKTAEDRLEPYELRTLYVRQIKRLAQRGLFGQAISVFRELSKNLGVTAATKRLSNMAISDLLNAREFPVDREAYRYLDRYVPFNYPSVNVLATSSHFQYDRTVKDRKEQLTDRTLRTNQSANSKIKPEETGESRGGGASSPLSESLEQARAHKKSASHYYIRVQCVTVRSISAIEPNKHAPNVIFLVLSHKVQRAYPNLHKKQEKHISYRQQIHKKRQKDSMQSPTSTTGDLQKQILIFGVTSFLLKRYCCWYCLLCSFFYLVLIFRLHEALFFKNERQASHMCNLFIKHFDFDPPSDVANDLEEANKETLAKSGLSVITICGMDLSSKKKLKKLKELLSRCPEVKKIELVFCSLTNERLLELFEAMMNLKCLLFLGKWLLCSEKGTAWPSGLRGNKLDNRVVFKLHKLLEEPDNFPALVWTDVRNNKGIITISGAFVQLLMQRRLTFNAEKADTPDERVGISVQDAMNGKVC